MIKRIYIGLAILVVLGAALFFALVWRPTIAPIAPGSVAGFPAELVAKVKPWPAQATARPATR